MHMLCSGYITSVGPASMRPCGEKPPSASPQPSPLANAEQRRQARMALRPGRTLLGKVPCRQSLPQSAHPRQSSPCGPCHQLCEGFKKIGKPHHIVAITLLNPQKRNDAARCTAWSGWFWSPLAVWHALRNARDARFNSTVVLRPIARRLRSVTGLLDCDIARRPSIQ
jgi:hypothetical protein